MSAGHHDDALVADLTARSAAAAAAASPGTQVSNVRTLTGGSSSLTYIADVDGGSLGVSEAVLKVAPVGLPPVRNRDVLRQARLLRALAGQPGVLVPRVLFEDAGNPVETSPFFAMNRVPGDCLEPVFLTGDARLPEATVRARALDGARMAAALHALSPAEIGLGDEPVMTLGDEIDRWTRAFETVSDELSGDYLRAAAALHATMPEPMEPVVNHGDFRLGNTLCEGDRITAIIDWEIWSIGDPRVDMTWYTFFADDAEHPGMEPTEPAGTPTRAELVAEYERAAGHTLADLRWFDALTKYKEASASALLIKRGLKANDLDPGLAKMIPAVPLMIAEAIDIVGG